MVSEIGLNFTGLENVTQNFSISVTTDPVELLNNIPIDANVGTGHLVGWVILFGLFIIMYWVLADRSPFGDFNYSDAKALNIGFGICSIIGIVMMEINYFTNFLVIGFFTTMFIITYIFTALFENKE